MKRCTIKYVYGENGIEYLKVNGMRIICSEFTLTHKATEYPQLDIKGVVGIMEDSEKHGKNISEIAKELTDLQKKQTGCKTTLNFIDYTGKSTVIELPDHGKTDD